MKINAMYMQITPLNIRSAQALLLSTTINDEPFDAGHWVCWPEGAIGREPWTTVRQPDFPVCSVDFDYVQNEYELAKTEREEENGFFQVMWKTAPDFGGLYSRFQTPTTPGSYFRTEKEAVDFLEKDAAYRTPSLAHTQAPILLGQIERRSFGKNRSSNSIVAQQVFITVEGTRVGIQVGMNAMRINYKTFPVNSEER